MTEVKTNCQNGFPKTKEEVLETKEINEQGDLMFVVLPFLQQIQPGTMKKSWSCYGLYHT